MDETNLQQEEQKRDQQTDEEVDMEDGKEDQGGGMEQAENVPTTQEHQDDDTHMDDITPQSEGDAGEEHDEHEADMELHEEHEADTEFGNGSPPKKQKTEGAQAEPVQLGYKTFHSGAECFQYFKHILYGVQKSYLLNEYEHKAMMDLLKKGHHNIESKTGEGIKGFFVQQNWNTGHGYICFHILQTDGNVVDFSYLKCIKGLFPKFELSKTSDQDGGGRKRGGRGRGRGRRGRSDMPRSGQMRGRGQRGGRRGRD